MDINPTNDQVSLTIVAACTAAGALTLAVWRVANFIRDVRDEMRGFQAELKRVWTRSEQERWAHLLERKNRGLRLYVPPISETEDEQNTPL
jgi:hypothetical protein